MMEYEDSDIAFARVKTLIFILVQLGLIIQHFFHRVWLMNLDIIMASDMTFIKMMKKILHQSMTVKRTPVLTFMESWIMII